MLDNRFLKPLASLRLTVVCLASAVVLVFWGTLAQVHLGLYQAQHDFFRSFFIFAQIPNTNWRVPVFPGGYLIGLVFLANLMAAHLSRFRFTWRQSGMLLAHGGLILLIVGLFLTDLLSTESAMQLSVGETRNYSEDFFDNELAVTGTGEDGNEHVVTIPESVVAKQGEIQAPGLPARLIVRHYWPHCDIFERPSAGAEPSGATHGSFAGHLVLPASSTSGGVPMGAAAVIELVSEGKSAGSWLLAALAQEPELFTLAGRRWKMFLNSIPEMGGNVLFLVDSGRPAAEQPAPIRETQLYAGNEISPARTPFKIRILKYWPKCRLFREPTPAMVLPRVTRGMFTAVMVEPLPPVKTTDSRNQPTAVVEVVTPEGSLGTWLLPAGFTNNQNFSVKGANYELAMRYKRHYKPFSVTLLNATHEKYPGTEIPKDFRSRVRVQRYDTGEVRESEIYMNAPLRFAGYTFFQYQMAADEAVLKAGRRPNSTFQVVKNPNWLTPYISCVLVAAGLLIQFLMHLTGFISKRTAA